MRTRATYRTKAIAVLLVAGVFAGGEGRLCANERQDLGPVPTVDAPEPVIFRSSMPPIEQPTQTLRASIRRWASIESRRVDTIEQVDTVKRTDCNRASVAEKLAFVYALVGGTLLLVYGPQEKEGDVWTMDGKSETVAGAVAIGLSFALFRDIRAKRQP